MTTGTTTMTQRGRSLSFTEINETEASGILSEILRDCDARLGGCSIGKGFHRAAKQHLDSKAKEAQQLLILDDNGWDEKDDSDATPPESFVPGPEDPFYIVDIGVVVSQLYQWRRFFPRIEPFYAVKCNPDPYILRTLGALGCNFDCASRGEIELVQSVTSKLPRKPDIIFANPCKPPSHVIYAVKHGVTMVTFDNNIEVEKCAKLSKKIQLILRIITDDRGAQCRLSSKFGAPRNKWRDLLQAAQLHGLPVVGVSFHVGSGCRDASRYELALKDARDIFDIAGEYGHKMHILDVGGGFPGETHGLWNPAVVEEDILAEEALLEGKSLSSDDNEIHDEQDGQRFMFFSEIAEQVSPIIDELFPPASGVRVIAEPGRYFVAAAATLCCSIISARSNILDKTEKPSRIDDRATCDRMQEGRCNAASGQSGGECVGSATGHSRNRSLSMGQVAEASFSDPVVMQTIHDELKDYSRLYANQQITQQEVDVYNDPLDLYKEGFDTAADLLGPPDMKQRQRRHYSVEGMNYSLIMDDIKPSETEPPKETTGNGPIITFAAAGEAAVNGVVLQAVADSGTLQDDYAYYMNDGVYGAFNNIMFDHANCRPRVLCGVNGGSKRSDNGLFTSTVFGPTCDSIDVIARSVLLPKLNVGDYLYFENMGAYTSAAASSFNGFTPSEKVYVCSVQPEYFEALIAGPGGANLEKKIND